MAVLLKWSVLVSHNLSLVSWLITLSSAVSELVTLDDVGKTLKTAYGIIEMLEKM